ncbi:MAG: hypothetical protein RL240_83 [Planctomycetota bacterium]|jgi:hypothetical protein
MVVWMRSLTFVSVLTLVMTFEHEYWTLFDTQRLVLVSEVFFKVLPPSVLPVALISVEEGQC